MDWMLLLWIVLLVVGFALLLKGADWFVDGAAGVAGKCRISPLVIGLTVVAFGTSAPELAVSIASAVQKSTDISIGNVVGSNITNILLILGLSALFHALPVQKNSLRLDLPVLVLASVLLVVLGAWGRSISWYDGLIFLALLIVYMALLFTRTRREQKMLPVPAEPPAEPEKKRSWFERQKDKLWFLIVLTVVGLAMVVGGGILLVDGAKYIARRFGVTERIIGLTVVAIGTSLPELITSVVAARKGETDIAVGNIIGSNLFNILLVAAVSSLFCPLSFTLEGNLIDALVALAATLLLCIFALVNEHKLGKVAGLVMLVTFAAYYTYLFLIPA